MIKITKAVDSSSQLRSKKDLIMNFIASINQYDDVQNGWHEYVSQQCDEELNDIITSERLKPNDTRKYMDNAFLAGEIKTIGTDLDRLLPPVSIIMGGRKERKDSVIRKFQAFFDKYFGITDQLSFTKK